MRIERPVGAAGDWTVVIGNGLPWEQKVRVPARLAGWTAGMVARTKVDETATSELRQVLDDKKTSREALLICRELLRMSNGGEDYATV